MPPKDFNGDGQINTADVQAIAAQWGQAAQAPFDQDGDGKVTITDIMAVTSQWGASC